MDNNPYVCDDEEPTHEELIEAGLVPTEEELQKDYEKQILDCCDPDEEDFLPYDGQYHKNGYQWSGDPNQDEDSLMEYAREQDETA